MSDAGTGVEWVDTAEEEEVVVVVVTEDDTAAGGLEGPGPGSTSGVRVTAVTGVGCRVSGIYSKRFIFAETPAKSRLRGCVTVLRKSRHIVFIHVGGAQETRYSGD